jgi:endonuclease YncB( thermonuclease family)
MLFISILCLGQILTGKVVGVTDGDTVTLLVGTTQKKIRLAEIDAPEKSQPFGNQSKIALSQKVFGKTVKANVRATDRYGRSVAIITVDGRNINQEMVREGMAWRYVQYSSDPETASAEMQARASRTGIWSIPYSQPPWEYRSSKKKSTNFPKPTYSKKKK